MSHFRRLRGLPGSAADDDAPTEPEAAHFLHADPAEACDADASALSLLASLRSAAAMPAPWEVAEEEEEPTLDMLPQSSPETPEAASRSPVVDPGGAAEAPAAGTAIGDAREPAPSSADADTPPARSEEQAASAAKAGQAHADHAAQLRGLLEALSSPQGAGATPAPAESNDPPALPQLDGLLASLRSCRASLDEQQQRSNASPVENDARGAQSEAPPAAAPSTAATVAAAQMPVAAPSAAADARRVAATAVTVAAGDDHDHGRHDDGDDDGDDDEEALDACALLERHVAPHVAQLFASESSALREMALGRLASLLMASGDDDAPAEAEVWRPADDDGGAGSDDDEAAAYRHLSAEALALAEGGGEAEPPRFWARATLLDDGGGAARGRAGSDGAGSAGDAAEDEEMLARGLALLMGGADAVGAVGDSDDEDDDEGEEGAQPPPQPQPQRARGTCDERLLAACSAAREALLDDEPRVRQAALALLDPHGALLSALLPCCSRRAAREALPLLLSPLVQRLGGRSRHEARCAADALLALAQHSSGGVALLRPHLLMPPLGAADDPELAAARLRLLVELLAAMPHALAATDAASRPATGRLATAQPSLGGARPATSCPATSCGFGAAHGGASGVGGSAAAAGGATLLQQELLGLCGQGLRADDGDVRQASVDLLLQLRRCAAAEKAAGGGGGHDDHRVERWLAQQKLPPALQLDLEKRLRAPRPQTPGGGGGLHGGSRASLLSRSGSTVGLVPPRTAAF